MAITKSWNESALAATVNIVPHRMRVDAEFNRQRSGGFPCQSAPNHFIDCRPIQLPSARSGKKSDRQLRAAGSSSLSVLIRLIFSNRAEKQMGWITAKAVIASMTNERFARLLAGAEIKGQAVRAQTGTGFSIAESLRAVTARDGPADPRPTLIRPSLVDAAQKPGNVFFGKVWHRKNLEYLFHERIVSSWG